MSNKLPKIGDRVSAPYTNEDGQEDFGIGELVDMNSRYATVKFSDKHSVKVGKTKIELFRANEEVEEVDEELDEDERKRIADGYIYEPSIAPSGRKSVSNGDRVAKLLQGKDLPAVRKIVAEVVGTTQKELLARYEHLNKGHQRMCLGNLLRGHLRNCLDTQLDSEK